MKIHRLLAAATLLSLLGCPSPQTASPTDGATAGPTFDATSDAGVQEAPELRLSLSFTSPDGTTADRPLRVGDRLTIDPVGSLVIHSNLALRNHRFRLFDEADRVIESDDQETRSDATGMEFTMAPGAPLKTGHRYSLILDSQTPGPILDASGKAWDEMRFEFLMAGEREKPVPVAKSKRRRRR